MRLEFRRGEVYDSLPLGRRWHDAAYRVLGGGALGLTLAYRLATAGDEVTVVEREREPGGLAAGFRVGPSWLEKFYHHLFRSDRAATRLIAEAGLADRLVWPRPITSTLINGEIHQLDSPLSLLRYRPLPFPDRVRMGMVVAYLKYVEKSHTRLEGKVADEWLRTWMGRRGYELQWEPLLRTKFHDHYTQVALPWFWSRVHLRSSELGYLRGGFQQLYDRLAEMVAARGGELLFGQSVTGIAGAPDGSVRVCLEGREREFDRVVSTLPTRLTLTLTEGLPQAYRERYDWGTALGRTASSWSWIASSWSGSTGSTSTTPATRSWRWWSTPTICRPRTTAAVTWSTWATTCRWTTRCSRPAKRRCWPSSCRTCGASTPRSATRGLRRRTSSRRPTRSRW